MKLGFAGGGADIELGSPDLKLKRKTVYWRKYVVTQLVLLKSPVLVDLPLLLGRVALALGVDVLRDEHVGRVATLVHRDDGAAERAHGNLGHREEGAVQCSGTFTETGRASFDIFRLGPLHNVTGSFF